MHGSTDPIMAVSQKIILKLFCSIYRHFWSWNDFFVGEGDEPPWSQNRYHMWARTWHSTWEGKSELSRHHPSRWKTGGRCRSVQRCHILRQVGVAMFEVNVTEDLWRRGIQLPFPFLKSGVFVLEDSGEADVKWKLSRTSCRDRSFFDGGFSQWWFRAQWTGRNYLGRTFVVMLLISDALSIILSSFVFVSLVDPMAETTRRQVPSQIFAGVGDAGDDIPFGEMGWSGVPVISHARKRSRLLRWS